MTCKNCIYLFEMTMPDENVVYWCSEKESDINMEDDRCNKYKCMTNADRIRDMTDEELAMLMDTATDYFNCDECEFRHLDDCGTNLLCQRHILKWLREEIK